MSRFRTPAGGITLYKLQFLHSQNTMTSFVLIITIEVIQTNALIENKWNLLNKIFMIIIIIPAS